MTYYAQSSDQNSISIIAVVLIFSALFLYNRLKKEIGRTVNLIISVIPYLMALAVLYFLLERKIITSYAGIILYSVVAFFLIQQFEKTRQRDFIPLYEIKSWNQLENMTPFQFEKYCASWLEHKGYKAYLTQASRDGGADILLENDSGEIMGIAECKHYKGPVSRKAVSDLHSLLMRKRKYRKAWFFSLNGYTDDALEQFSGKKNFKLMSGKDLVN